jgi:hypothetical protein
MRQGRIGREIQGAELRIKYPHPKTEKAIQKARRRPRLKTIPTTATCRITKSRLNKIESQSAEGRVRAASPDPMRRTESTRYLIEKRGRSIHLSPE